jgi:thiol-disulfide isomerase/thioredoxin
MANNIRSWIAGVVILFGLPLAVRAASADAPPEFPQSPEQWINSAPLSTESLKGKAVVLYYFEETCPSCRGMWPARLEVAKKFEGKPVLFIAVNSGTPRPAIQQYVKETGVTWPVLLDFSREFEKKSDVHEINLQNIYQVRVIDGDGRFAIGDFNNLEGTTEAALKNAHWRVEPDAVPALLKPAWLNVEMANFPAAAKPIKTNLMSNKPDIKAAAEKLNAAVDAEMAKDLDAADKLAKSDKKWDAYKAYLRVSDRYQGYTMPEIVSNAKTELSGSDDVKPELVAHKALEAAKRLITTDRSPGHARAVAALKKVIADHENTEAGAEAKTMLAGS